MIFSVRTTAGQESLVVDMLQKKLENEPLEIYSLVVMPELKGYILTEGDCELSVRRLITSIPHIKGKGIVGGNIPIAELTTLLEAKPLMESIKEGIKIRLISGPFKGERARVIRINKAKEEVTVELLEAAVKIPVTTKAENIRILK